MNRQLVREVPALGHSDGVDLSDEVGHRDVRSRKLFGVPPLPGEPLDSNAVAVGIDLVSAVSADWCDRAIVDFATGDHRNCLVKQAGQVPGEPGFGLASLSQQYQVLACKEGVLDLGCDRVFEADYAGKKLLAALNLGDEVLTDLLFDGRRLETAVAQFGYSLRLTALRHRCHLRSFVRSR